MTAGVSIFNVRALDQRHRQAELARAASLGCLGAMNSAVHGSKGSGLPGREAARARVGHRVVTALCFPFPA